MIRSFFLSFFPFCCLFRSFCLYCLLFFLPLCLLYQQHDVFLAKNPQTSAFEIAVAPRSLEGLEGQSRSEFCSLRRTGSFPKKDSSTRGRRHRPTRSSWLSEVLASKTAKLQKSRKATPILVTVRTCGTYSQTEASQVLAVRRMVTNGHDERSRPQNARMWVKSLLPKTKFTNPWLCIQDKRRRGRLDPKT